MRFRRPRERMGERPSKERIEEMAIETNFGRTNLRGDSWTPTLRTFALSSVWNSLGRFERRVARVTITLRDLNGPRGGVDKECSIDVESRRGRGAFGRATSANEYAAIAKACARIRRQLIQSAARRTSLSRQRLVHAPVAP
jgi:hypothetical protein